MTADMDRYVLGFCFACLSLALRLFRLGNRLTQE